jgi:hypothetical protein
MKTLHNNKELKSKGQVQLGETTAVIIIVIILLIIGIVFWNKISSSNVREIQTQSSQLQVIDIANSVSELTELKCSEEGASPVKCLDWYKVLAMSEVINNTDNKTAFMFYNDYFQNSKITIVSIYPEEKDNITLYDAHLNNVTSLLISLPIHIKDYVTKETSYGLIVVEGYYKN